MTRHRRSCQLWFTAPSPTAGTKRQNGRWGSRPLGQTLRERFANLQKWWMERRMAVVKAPALKRIDPPSRPPMDMEERMRLKNQDPEKAYHWATEGGTFGRDFYESMGYEVEVYTEGGVGLLMGGHSRAKREMGHPITQLGLTLMSCPMSLKKAMEEGGQKIADVTEQKMITRRVTQDTMRGIDLRGPHGPIMSVENETGPAVPYQV